MNMNTLILFLSQVGIGYWGLWIGSWGLAPLPNPQSPIPNPLIFYYSNIF